MKKLMMMFCLAGFAFFSAHSGNVPLQGRMKKSINFILCIIFALALNACSSNTDDPESFDFDFDFDELLITYQNFFCPSVTDAIKYPEPWTSDVEKTFIKSLIITSSFI